MRRRRWPALGLLVAVGCAAQNAHSSGGTLLSAHEARVFAPNAPTGPTVAGLDQLGVDLWQLAARNGNGNVVVSPLSVGLAFSMARDGVVAGGSALDAVLHFATTGRDTAFDRLISGVVTTSVPPPMAEPSPSATPDPGAPPPPPIVAIANALFVEHGFAVEKAFLKTLAQVYGAGVRTVDFTKPAAIEVLNAWAKTQTAGRITKLFDQLDPKTKLVLANAIYLKAAWVAQFTASLTRPEPFTTADGHVVHAPTMKQDGLFAYAKGEGWQAVELPYAGGTLAMRVLLPDPGRTASETLTAATLRALPGSLRTFDVALKLPRWETTTSLDPLSLPGLAQVAAAADLSGIAPDLVLTAAIHRAVITVNERGTVAAAVTALAFAVSGSTSIKSVTLTFDRPFAYEIVDTATQAPLFVGAVTDPTNVS